MIDHEAVQNMKDAFQYWMRSLPFDIGDNPEDQKDWKDCFEAGYQKGREFSIIQRRRNDAL